MRHVTIAFNNKQTRTSIKKDVLEKRIANHQDKIKKAQMRAKILNLRLKSAPNESKQSIVNSLTKIKENIEKSKQAIKHYKRLSSFSKVAVLEK